ncbi:MAG: plasmid stabilization protein [Gemmatimonadota bacterium]|nr:plasmid stabilization protein [Gemmatimonadota bacterium]
MAAGREGASITIQKLGDELKRRLRIRAEEEVPAEGLGTAIHELFAPLGGVELEIPPREPMREPPRFD